jgi:HKD family nuclease
MPEISALAPAKQLPYRSLLGFAGDAAAVIGLPDDFNLQAALSNATAIRLAFAFAHLNGWKLLASPILKSSAAVQIVAGLDFFQTEPKLLREWRRLANSSGRKALISARLASRITTFHPKVLIVTTKDDAPSFAIVGSGNLSVGGLRTNTECSLYTADENALRNLIEWFDEQWQNARRLSEADIKEYESKYKEVRAATDRVRKAQKAVQEAIKARAEAIFRNRAEAIEAAKKYFSTAQYKRAYENRKSAVDRIRQALDLPHLHFDEAGWKDFYSIAELGRLRPTYRASLFKRHERLTSALKFLLDDHIALQERLASILKPNGQHRLHGLGINLVSKLLSAHNPQKWPVLNGPVVTTLRDFGYEPPRSAGKTGRYLAFVEAMDSFKTECQAPDVLALDAFFRYWHQRVKHRKRSLAS